MLGLVSFLAPYNRYRYVKACGNPLPRVAQVFIATARKWSVEPAKGNELYELEGSESAIKGSRKIHHSEEFRLLLLFLYTTLHLSSFSVQESFKISS